MVFVAVCVGVVCFVLSLVYMVTLVGLIYGKWERCSHSLAMYFTVMAVFTFAAYMGFVILLTRYLLEAA